MATTESLNRDELGDIDIDCYVFNNLVSDGKRLKGHIKMKFETGREITYEFLHPPVKVSKDIYMVSIVGTDVVYSGETGATVATGYFYFEDNMDAYMLSQVHPNLGSFVGVRDGEITDEIIQKYAEVDASARGK